MSPLPPPPTGTATADLLTLEFAETPPAAGGGACGPREVVEHRAAHPIGPTTPAPVGPTPVRPGGPARPGPAAAGWREPARGARTRPDADPSAPTRRFRAPAWVEPTEPRTPPPADGACELPGSRGEHMLQEVYGTRARAERFYSDQVLDHLNPRMVEFIGRMEMAFVATADAHGECDSTFRAGPPGFIHVLDERRVAYPEYRGNGVMASLGNISENPHVGILMMDFTRDLIGLHVNGRATVVEDAELRAANPDLPAEFDRGRTPERWVLVEVQEAYVHCRKHVPMMRPVDRTRDWGTDDVKRKGGDYFEARRAAQVVTG